MHLVIKFLLWLLSLYSFLLYSDMTTWSVLFCNVIIFPLAYLWPHFLFCLCFFDLLPLPNGCVSPQEDYASLHIDSNPIADGCVSPMSVFTWVLLLKVWLWVGLWTAGTIIWPQTYPGKFSTIVEGYVEYLGSSMLSIILMYSHVGYPFICSL